MVEGRFFAEPHGDAVMGSLLGLTGELLVLAARQRRIEAAIGAGVDGQASPPDLAAPLDPDERAWVAQRADELVAAWLGPFLAPAATDPPGARNAA